MAKLVTMTAEGRVTIPAAARRELDIDGETELEVNVDAKDGSIVLRPAVVMTREDAWAYTPEHRRLLAKAHRDSRDGRVVDLSYGELERIATSGKLPTRLRRRRTRTAK